MNLYAIAVVSAMLVISACTPPSGREQNARDRTASKAAAEANKPKQQPMPDAGNALTLSQLSSDLFAKRAAVAMGAAVPAFDDRSMQIESPDGRVSALRYADTDMMEVASFNRPIGDKTPAGKGREVDFLMAAMPIMTRLDASTTITAMVSEEEFSGYVSKRDIADDRISVSTTGGLMVMVEKRKR